MLKVKWGVMSLLLLLKPFNKANKKVARKKENQNSRREKKNQIKKRIKEKFDNTFSKE